MIKNRTFMQKLILIITMAIVIPIIMMSLLYFSNRFNNYYLAQNDRMIQKAELQDEILASLLSDRLLANRRLLEVITSDFVAPATFLKEYKEGHTDSESIINIICTSDNGANIISLNTSLRGAVLDKAYKTKQEVFWIDQYLVVASHKEDQAVYTVYEVLSDFFQMHMSNMEHGLLVEGELIYVSKASMREGLLKSLERGEDKFSLDKTEYKVHYSEFPGFDFKVVHIMNNVKGAKNFLRGLQSMGISLFLLFVLLTLSLVIAVYLSFSSLKRIKTGIEGVFKKDYAYRIKSTFIKEVDYLIQAFNRLASKIEIEVNKLNEKTIELKDKNEEIILSNEGLVTSVLELEELNEALRVMHSTNENILNNFDSLIINFNQKGEIIFGNRQAKDRFRNGKEVKGRKLLDYLIRDEKKQGMKKKDVYHLLVSSEVKEFVLWITDETSTKEWIYFVNTKIIETENGKEILLAGHDITEEVITELNMDKRNEELSLLNAIDLELIRYTSFDQFTESLTARLVELFEAELCTIRFVEGDNLILDAASGPLSHEIKERSVPIKASNVGRAVLENRIIRYRGNEVDRMRNFGRNDVIKIHEPVQELVFIPIDYEGEIIAVLTLGSFKALSEINIKFLKSIRNHVKMWLEKAKLFDSLRLSFLSTMKALTGAMEKKDQYTEGHSIRVAEYSKIIGQELGLGESELDDLYFSAILHDVGKLGISDNILTKNGALSHEEFMEIMSHPMKGYEILKHIDLSAPIIEGIYLHHKRYDLEGYPVEVDLTVLPLFPSIIGVADALDAMLSKRSYNQRKSIGDAIEEIQKYAGSQFHPAIAGIIEKIYQETPEKIKNIVETQGV